MEINLIWGGIAVLMLALLLAFFLIKQLKQQLLQNERAASQKIDQLQRDIKVLNLELNEIRQSTVGVGKTVKTLGQYFSQLEQKFNEVELFEPESKLYSRAAKLAEKGASVEEIMTECEIPRAEAELVLSLRNKMAR
ncbi:DNA repair ATPase [Catenovulum agarivorans DS-2]|uniref:DNA repair ATPase n=1 Tax=Catenovulum agarivorans DS-2 TaxID=1328313 RepID=W7QBT3_9ALTE|nr:DUF2802 domain-containing protein [Catenovulum agarivorans]EWH09461.1 DNA repair ATPase [Catenovulum agarivorans DS-2]